MKFIDIERQIILYAFKIDNVLTDGVLTNSVLADVGLRQIDSA